MRQLQAIALVCTVAAAAGCLSKYSTDIPVNYQVLLNERYVGRSAWTRRSLQDEKKNVRIEQDMAVELVALGMHRTGSFTVVAKQGHKRVVFPLHLGRPLSLEIFEKTLLDYLWFESPEERFEANKTKYGTRLAEAVRDHKILKDMPQFVAYLSWGNPDSVDRPEGTSVERWQYDNSNLPGARIDFLAGKVAQYDGENISDTEAAKKRKLTRRGSSEN